MFWIHPGLSHRAHDQLVDRGGVIGGDHSVSGSTEQERHDRWESRRAGDHVEGEAVSRPRGSRGLSGVLSRSTPAGSMTASSHRLRASEPGIQLSVLTSRTTTSGDAKARRAHLIAATCRSPTVSFTTQTPPKSTAAAITLRPQFCPTALQTSRSRPSPIPFPVARGNRTWQRSVNSDPRHRLLLVIRFMIQMQSRRPRPCGATRTHEAR